MAVPSIVPVFEAVGVSPMQEAVYLALLEAGGGDAASVARASGITDDQAEVVLASLEGIGLAAGPDDAGQWRVRPPDVAIEPLVLRAQERLSRARLVAAELSDRLRRRIGDRSGDELVEVVAGREQVQARIVELLESTRDELCWFDRPPYVATDGMVVEQEVGERAMLDRGAVVRSVYDPDGLTGERLTHVRAMADLGEQARTARVPLKLMVSDGRHAVLPLRTEHGAVALIVHPSPLLDALMHLFSLVWDRATPLRPVAAAGQTEGHGEPDEAALGEDDRTLLMLLAAGHKDEYIAAHLRLNQRTVERRIRRLFQRLGVETRFQAGVAAGRRGLLQ